MSDFLEISNRPLQDLQAEIDDNQNRLAVDSDLVEVQSGQAQAAFRLQGGFLTRLVLKSQSGGDLVDVLYSDADLTKPRLPASHAMMPVGPSDWPGGQHGPIRWVRHDVAGNSPNEEGTALVALVPRMARELPFVVRRAQLDESVIALGLSVTNRSDEPVGLSLGEHLYFAMAEGSASDVRINGQGIDGLLGQGASDLVDQGMAQFWPGFTGRAEVDMPDGTSMGIFAKLVERGQVTPRVAESIGMLIWRRPGKPFICLEPTAGYDLDGSNNNLTVAPNADVLMLTSIVQR